MAAINNKMPDVETAEPAVDWSVAVVLVLAAAAGALLAAALLPRFLPGVEASLAGAAPQAFWFLARGSALVSFILLWASMALGLLITNRLARAWPGGPAAFELHQYVSLLGLGLGVFHALILTGDQYLRLSVFNVLVPFALQAYRPLWVGLGQLALYAWALLVGSFYVRKQLGTRAWRAIHFASFGVFALALAHGLVSGSDSAAPAAQALYWLAGGSLLFLLYYRIFALGGLRRAKSPMRPVEK